MSRRIFAQLGPLLPSLGCALVVLAAIAIAHPAGEIPMGDEVSYIHSARTLAQTGHIEYIGFVNAIVGWQLYWGGAAIRMFGPSILVLRWSMAAVAVATVLLLHRCFVRVGVRPVLAVAGTLTFCLSPLFLSKATTYMTDVPGVIAVVVSLYGCLRALKARGARTAIAWLGVATVGNSVLGSSRQIPWLGALVMVPCALWLLRKRRGVLLAGAGLWVVSLLMDCAMQAWFMRQPYTDREPTLMLGMTPHRVQVMLLGGVGALLETGLLLLPVLLVLLPALAKRRLPWGVYAAAVLFGAGALGVWHVHAAYALLLPYVGPSFRWPLAGGLQVLLTTAIVVGLLALLTVILARRKEGPRVADGVLEQAPTGFRVATIFEVRVLVLPFLVAYLVALLPRSYNIGLWDRYMLTPAMVLLVWLLREYQDVLRWPKAVLALALCGGVYATALLHDDFAYERARLAALSELAAQGVPRTAVTGGWPYDIDTELQFSRYVNAPGLRLPAGVVPPVSTHYGIDPCEGFQCDLVPHVVPKYAVTNEAGRALAGFAAVPYRGWVTASGAFYVTPFP